MVSTYLSKIRDATRQLARFLRRRQVSEGYVAFITASVPDTGGTITLRIANPTTDRVIDIQRFIVTSHFEGRVRIYDSFDGDVTGGTDVGIDNLRMDAGGGPPDSGTMVAESGVTFTATGTHFDAVVPGGGPGGSIGGRGDGTEPLIDPGREIVVELENTSGTAELGTVAAVYTEAPMSAVPDGG